jgi:hypothetical protein
MIDEEALRMKLFAGAAMKTAIKGLLSHCELRVNNKHGKNHRHTKLLIAMEHWCNGTNPRNERRDE